MTQPAPLPPLAPLPDLEARLGVSLSAEADVRRAEAALGDASALVRQLGNPQWGAVDYPCPAAVVAVVLSAAGRVFRNPDNLVARTRGPFSDRVADGHTRGVFLTDEEELTVTRAVRVTTTSFRGLWTLATGRGEYSSDSGTTWLNDQYGTERFPT